MFVLSFTSLNGTQKWSQMLYNVPRYDLGESMCVNNLQSGMSESAIGSFQL